MRMVAALGLTLGVLSASSARATTYYLRTACSDGNAGTSEAAPWQSLAKLNA